MCVWGRCDEVGVGAYLYARRHCARDTLLSCTGAGETDTLMTVSSDASTLPELASAASFVIHFSP